MPVEMSARDLSTHMLILGGTGRGKSTLMEYMARGLALRGAGYTIIDPHGSLGDNLSRWLAVNAPGRRVHVVEPSASRWSFGLNPLLFSIDALSSGIQSVANSISAAWGHEDFDEKPRLRRTLTAVLCLLASHRLTLADAVPLLSPRGALARQRLGDDLVHPFFRGEWQQFALMPEKQRIEYFESVSNRLGPFLSSDPVRAMLGQTDRVLDVASIMENGDILIVNLRPSAHFSVSDGKLVGTLLVNEFTQRALLRKPGARHHALFIDEATRFINDDVQTILDETRKYGLSLVAATQRLGALRAKSEGVYDALLSIQSKVVFGGLNTDDAELIARDVFAGDFDLQRKKTRITTPTVVGHRVEWLDSESESDAVSDSESFGESMTEGLSASESESLNFDTETGEPDPVVGVTTADGTSFSQSRTQTFGHGRSHSATHGRHQSLRPVLEERSTQTFSLQELIHLRSVTLKNLPVGCAVAKIAGRRAVRMGVPRLGNRADAATGALYRSARIALTPSATPLTRALLGIDQRQAVMFAGPEKAPSQSNRADEVEILPPITKVKKHVPARKRVR